MAVIFTATLSVQAQEIEVTNSEVHLRSENNYGSLKFYNTGHLLLNLSSSSPQDYAFTINVPYTSSRALTVRRNWASPAAFEVWGSGVVKANNVVLSSDSTLKDNIQPLDSQIENMKKIKSFTYKWKDIESKGDKKNYGLLAQDLEKVFPDMVFTDETGEKGIYYIELIPILLQVAQEQQYIIENQAKQLQDLEDRLAKLEKKDK